jgi:transcriptional regulator with GAF, ATPase, and Fis domain
MGDLAVQLQAQPDRHQTLTAILQAAVTTIPGAEIAGVSLVQGREITTEVLTSDVAQRLDELQVELDDGPCLTSLRHEHVVRVDELATDPRWPHFAARAVELGVHSVLSFQLFVQEDNLGALNLYSSHPHAFDEDAYTVGHLFAQHASVAYAGASREHHLNRALATRDVIGQAKGILMHRDRLSAQQAFNLLVRTSQQVNMKLADVARWLVGETEKNAEHE